MTRNTLATATITSCSAESNSLGANGDCGKFSTVNGLNDVVAACLPSIDVNAPFFGEIFDELILQDGYCALLAEDIDNSASNDKMIDSLMNYRDDKVNISPSQLSKVKANESMTIDTDVWEGFIVKGRENEYARLINTYFCFQIDTLKMIVCARVYRVQRAVAAYRHCAARIR